MFLDSYAYDFRDGLIAQRLASPRDTCRLLVLDDDIMHGTFRGIIDYLEPGDVLVLNDTKVTYSKLVGKKESGSPAEVILLKKISDKIYEAKIKTRNPHTETRIICKNGRILIKKQINIDTFAIELSDDKILEGAILPTPPYIKRKLDDKEYQTEFSKREGSLAAPTAGLHFTKRLLKKISDKGVKIACITLHVSYGTFKKIDDIKSYIMDPEYYDISKDAADIINNRIGRLVVCGTTTLKALETSSKSGKIIPGKGASRLFIYPPYKFRSGTDILITNFHLPKSTLLLMTCAFGGKKKVLDAYDVAIKKGYRLFSLGDAMMISRPKAIYR
jgi:S-adenosylmethionine:tRNA ribosyltransferase-isomerase